LRVGVLCCTVGDVVYTNLGNGRNNSPIERRTVCTERECVMGVENTEPCQFIVCNLIACHTARYVRHMYRIQARMGMCNL